MNSRESSRFRKPRLRGRTNKIMATQKSSSELYTKTAPAPTSKTSSFFVGPAGARELRLLPHQCAHHIGWHSQSRLRRRQVLLLSTEGKRTFVETDEVCDRDLSAAGGLRRSVEAVPLSQSSVP